MTGWIVAVAEGLELNWDLAKEHQLWGTRSPSGYKVHRGDDLFFWSSGVGWLAHCRATTDARPRAAVASVPWPEPKPYTYLSGIEVIDEPSTPVVMSGAAATALAGLGTATIRLGQLPALSDVATRAVAAVFSRPSSVELAMVDLLVAAGIESPEMDNRTFSAQMIAVRQGQQGSRAGLLRAFGGRCCITGTSVEQTLDAAHIRPFRGVGSLWPGTACSCAPTSTRCSTCTC